MEDAGDPGAETLAELLVAADKVVDDLLELLRWPEVTGVAVMLGIDLDADVAGYLELRPDRAVLSS